jgi:hypothetical protein
MVDCAILVVARTSGVDSVLRWSRRFHAHRRGSPYRGWPFTLDDPMPFYERAYPTANGTFQKALVRAESIGGLVDLRPPRCGRQR